MRGSSIKIVRHIIKGKLDVACVWGSRELDDACFLSLSIGLGIWCTGSSVLQAYMCCLDHCVRMAETNLLLCF